LVEEPAVEQAEAECLADEDVRAKQRERAALRRASLDQQYVKQFAGAIAQQFPRCPRKIAESIARHACAKYSGRVGRSSAAKNLDAEAVRLAVIAHIRHEKTRYDELLMDGWDRRQARQEVADKVDSVLCQWQGKPYS
jgi:hypothetical protein